MSESSLTSSKSQRYAETFLRRHTMANSYVEQSPALPTVSKGQIKPQVGRHLRSLGVAFVRKTDYSKCWQRRWERMPLYTVDWSVDWYSHVGKQHGVSSKNSK